MENSIQIADIHFWHQIVRVSWPFPKSDHISFLNFGSRLFGVFCLNYFGLGKHTSWLSFLGLSQLVIRLYVLQDNDYVYLLNFFHYFGNTDFFFFLLQ